MPDFGRDYCEPGFESWGDLLSAQPDRKTFRSSVIDLAYRYTQSLQTLLPGVFPGLSDLNLEPEYVIMTGHQPEIYHPGILYKNILLERAARTYPATVAINIIIDTDEAEEIALVHPLKKGSHFSLAYQHMVEQPALYMFQRFLPKDDISMIFSECESGLRSCDLSLSPSFLAASSYYSALAENPVTEVNTAIRRVLTGAHHSLELPLSALCHLPEVQQFFLKIIRDWKHFHLICNEVLSQYRHDHQIENRLNPFPDLRETSDTVELPFWLVDRHKQTRESLFVHEDSQGTLFLQRKYCLGPDDPLGLRGLSARQLFIAPKAIMTMLVLRLLCADFFIHGRGGAQYDQFTDRFSVRYFSTELSPFAMVSADRYLFPQQIAQLERQQSEQFLFREMLYKTEKYLQEGYFDDPAQQIIVPLLKKKKDIVARMQQPLLRQERIAHAQQLKQLDEQLKDYMKVLFAKPPSDSIVSTDKRDQDVYYYRKFPFFFFDSFPDIWL